MVRRSGVVASACRVCAIAGGVTLATVLCAGLLLAGGRVAAQSGIGGGMSSGAQSGGPVGVQSGAHQTGSIGSASNGSPSLLDPGTSPFPDNSRLKRNDERQRRLVSDTQKLLALTAQLKAEVASSGAETMTPEMLKQMDEIEKLAKSVKDKMRE